MIWLKKNQIKITYITVLVVLGVTSFVATAINKPTPIVSEPLGVIEVACKDNITKSIEQRIQECPILSNAKEKANLKGVEIARVVQLQKYIRPDYDIEIVEIKAIEGGVEVFARAWNKNGSQIGFGKDGSVDMERFRIYNPPILVDDLNGTIIREWTDDITNKIMKRTLREDPNEALLQVLEHNLSVMKNIRSGENIVVGKRGNTTSTFYPDADVESTSVDGYVARVNQTSWAAAREPLGGTDAPDNTTLLFVDAEEEFAENFTISRVFVLFDTSAITDEDTISSATLSLWPTTGEGADRNCVIANATPASDTGLVVGDYDALTINTPTEFTTARIDYSTIGAYTNATLNSDGLTNISKTGVSKFSVRHQDDVDNNQPTVGRQYAQFSSSDTAGTTQDPKLVVEHSGAAEVGVGTFYWGEE